jgi:fatty acid-binding protein DegV
LLTDRTICIPREEADALQLHIVSNSYSIQGQAYWEGFSDENGDFEQRIICGPRKLQDFAGPVAGFIETFRELIAQGMEVLCLVISSSER